jgi:hypothetical protein
VWFNFYPVLLTSRLAGTDKRRSSVMAVWVIGLEERRTKE